MVERDKEVDKGQIAEDDNSQQDGFGVVGSEEEGGE